MGILKRAIAKDASVVASAVDATDIVAEIERIHKTSAVVTAALGRLSIAACMMGYDLKNEKDTVTLRVKGGGPAGMLVAVADSHGNVKADVDQPVVELPLNAKGKLDVGGALGIGVLSVIKDIGLKEPYVGQTILVTSEIAEDLTYYFATSEQTPSSVALGVLMNKDNTVRQAGGFILQLLPGASEEVISTLENRLKEITSITSLLDAGNTTEMILEHILGDFGLEILDKIPTQFACNCSRERIEKALISIGKKELQEMIDEGKTIEMNCHFCNKHYPVTVEELKGLLEKAVR